MIRFIDMFCGIGGFRLGLERADTPKQESGEARQATSGITGQGNRGRFQPLYRCVWANDNDRYACQIYRRHFGEVHEGDIRAVDADAIPEHDLLCAGFPCQSFSIAGKRRGFEDTRGTLFFEICRVLRAKRPSYLFLENVRGLLSHDDGSTFETIIGTLDELGYDLQWQVLNSKDYGVPQNRERVFIIGHFRGKPRPKVFPLGEDNQGIIEGADEATSIRALQGGGHSGGHHSGMTLLYDIYNQQLRANQDLAGTLKGEGVSDTSLGTALLAPSITAEMAHGTGFNQTPRVIKAMGQIRRLTPLECERLQSFPDGWTEGISDTQRYKCLGNAVTTNVITAIGRQLIGEIDG